MMEKNKNLIVALYKTNRLYAIGVIAFFFFYFVFPLVINAGLIPFFRNWDMYKTPVSIDSTYGNMQIVINDSFDIQKKHYFNDNWPLIVGPVWCYLNLRYNGSDGLYVLESGMLHHYFPNYAERQHNSVSDTVLFRKVFLSNLSQLLGTKVDAATIYLQQISYDSAGYVHFVGRKKLADFR